MPGPARATFLEQVCSPMCARAPSPPGAVPARPARASGAGDAAAAGHDTQLCSPEPQRKLVVGAEQVTDGNDVSLSFIQA